NELLGAALVCAVVAVGAGLWALLDLRRARGRVRGREVAWWGVGGSLGGVFLALLGLPLEGYLHAAAVRVRATEQGKRIGRAFQAYGDDHKQRLPPAAVRDPEGRPLLSWRVLLLSYLGDEDLFLQFRLDEPWDSPHNRTLLPRMPDVYRLITW